MKARDVRTVHYFAFASGRCGTGSAGSACRKDEERTHHDNQKACEAAKKLCKKNCYNEGAGNAGA